VKTVTIEVISKVVASGFEIPKRNPKPPTRLLKLPLYSYNISKSVKSKRGNVFFTNIDGIRHFRRIEKTGAGTHFKSPLPGDVQFSLLAYP